MTTAIPVQQQKPNARANNKFVRSRTADDSLILSKSAPSQSAILDSSPSTPPEATSPSALTSGASPRKERGLSSFSSGDFDSENDEECPLTPDSGYRGQGSQWGSSSDEETSGFQVVDRDEVPVATELSNSGSSRDSLISRLKRSISLSVQSGPLATKQGPSGSYNPPVRPRARTTRPSASSSKKSSSPAPPCEHGKAIMDTLTAYTNCDH